MRSIYSVQTRMSLTPKTVDCFSNLPSASEMI